MTNLLMDTVQNEEQALINDVLKQVNDSLQSARSSIMAMQDAEDHELVVLQKMRTKHISSLRTSIKQLNKLVKA